MRHARIFGTFLLTFASLAGWGAGKLIDMEGYGYVFTFRVFGIAAILGALLVCVIWSVRPDTLAAEAPGQEGSEES